MLISVFCRSKVVRSFATGPTSVQRWSIDRWPTKHCMLHRFGSALERHLENWNENGSELSTGNIRIAEPEQITGRSSILSTIVDFTKASKKGEKSPQMYPTNCTTGEDVFLLPAGDKLIQKG